MDSQQQLSDKIKFVIDTLNEWSHFICQEVNKRNLDKEVNIRILQNQIILNNLPEDFILFTRGNKSVSIQIIKPVVDIILCYTEENTNEFTFTNDINEALEFLISTNKNKEIAHVIGRL